MPASNSDARKRHDERIDTSDYTMGVPIGMPPVLEPATVIGLSGWAQAGKDSLASVLVEEYGFESFSFADPLRDLAANTCPLVEVTSGNPRWKGDPVFSTVIRPRWFLHDPEGYEWLKANTTYRDYLQDLGMAVRDVFGEDTFVEAAMSRLKPGVKYVNTSVRFPNEAAAIRALPGGEVWRITRHNHKPANQHVSETALDDYVPSRYLTVPNYKGDADKLRAALSQLLKAVFAR